MDGCSIGNPWNSGAGGVIKNDKAEVIANFRRSLGVRTNFEAEFMALMIGIETIIQLNVQRIWIECDSVAVIFDEQEYAIAVLSILLITAISTPILRILHDPTKSYTTTIRRTIQDTKRNSELRMLVCIQRQENVPTMINLIEVSHANRENPISVIVLKLVELVGRASPILVAHNNDELPSSQNGGGNRGGNNSGKISSSSSCRYDQIFNAFQQYKLLNEDCISIQQFTAISHVATMHDDVCQVACDKRATIIIVPFHKEWSIDGSISSVNSGLRNMNLNILKKAPCSVGVLVDRGIMQGSLSVITSRSSFYHVAVLLMGGADDGEALAYGSRIALHQHVKVTIIFLNDNNINNKKMVTNQMERYKLTNEVNDRIDYREEVVTDGERLGALIRDILEEGNDLTIVGKRQWRDSPLFSGLTEWNECPELGVIGDMLASPDFGTTSSILVVQQQRQVCQTKSTGGSIDITNHGAKTDFSIHDVPMNENGETLRVTLDKMC
ncbi:cation/H(+) antiporter 15-like [Macadamia integrifolia]|uniref:cation/H(+) antiporter 15-like n=1 Tax=Macadamia integrifolia TaxID=60698 RepID=UPI001C4EFB97|nr:cation/H(+) antiporter 15-like [Macadamia integrifolia]